MPEGDTIFRTAVNLKKWIDGRVVTGASTTLATVPVGTLVGRTVDGVQAVGKHLLIRFSGDPLLILRTHMRMTGSWHVYSAGDDWQRPRRQARIVLETGDRLAVCFNAPIVELFTEPNGRESVAVNDAVGHLGPDILAEPFDVARAVERARLRSAGGRRAIGEVLLDQCVVAGIGNIYRCESLFAEGVSPWINMGSLTDTTLTALLLTAERQMKANLGVNLERTFTANSTLGKPRVYRRAHRPCFVCSVPIRSRAQGEQARMAYWCPTCQPEGLISPP